MKAFFFVALLSSPPFAANAAVVCSQPHDLSGTLMQSSGNGNDYDMFVWDNFTLSPDQEIGEIDWRGITLGGVLLSLCPAFDCNADGQVTVDCVIQAVYTALDGCPAVVQPHP